jgi:hypothetical protein
MSVVSHVHIQIANVAVLFASESINQRQLFRCHVPHSVYVPKHYRNLAYAYAMKISPLFLAYISILFLCFHIFFDEFKIPQLPYYEVLFKSCSQWKHAASLLLG